MDAKTAVRFLIWVMVAALAAGCATRLPKQITETPPGDPSVAEVRADIDRFTGAPVRWGGTIVDVDNSDPMVATLEIVARELRRNGQPASVDASPGRFLAVFDGFLDPAIFYEGRDITVYGAVEGERAGRIGGRDYDYPVVRVEAHELWRIMDPRDYPPAYRGYYYDAFYPWGPYMYPYPRYRFPVERPPMHPSILRE